jgi:acyl-CoA synthetase (AMP-forming)/AMP-acid ligase II
VIVIGIPDEYRGEAAKAFVKLRNGGVPFTLEELKVFLAGKLGKHEIPAALDFVDDLPRIAQSTAGAATRAAPTTATRIRRPSVTGAVR